MEEKESFGDDVGVVEKYFAKIEVAAITLTGNLNAGDTIRIKGATTDFEQTVDSMQINREEIKEGKTGDDIGIKVIDRARPGDKVYKVN